MSISSKINRRTIQTAVGLFIMLFFWLLPIDIPYITPMGMKVIGIFIGTIYISGPYFSGGFILLCL